MTISDFYTVGLLDSDEEYRGSDTLHHNSAPNSPPASRSLPNGSMIPYQSMLSLFSDYHTVHSGIFALYTINARPS